MLKLKVGGGAILYSTTAVFMEYWQFMWLKSFFWHYPKGGLGKYKAAYDNLNRLNRIQAGT